ncbi:MAG: aminoglycoside 3'-phosphotransferase [Humibacillus sp.]|nr:aminoglycoside 3'-phosphotransferase [Humibacillus sp.]MDN5775443.1 aminoglycoside 3'-phosphotransferase [Humibacillus sp.]
MVNAEDRHGSDAPGGTVDEWARRFQTLKPDEVPAPILDDLSRKGTTSDSVVPELVWRNELGGQTWRLADRYLKWSPHAAGIDLRREIQRLRWLEGRHPAPLVLGSGDDSVGQWMLTAALDADTAVSDFWRSHPEQAVRAIAEGLRRLHALPFTDAPSHWESWVSRTPPELGPRPSVTNPVLVHGDACSPNTLIDADGRFAANVDVGDLAVGDRWADLAVGAMSLEWNYGAGWDGLFYEVYGVEPDSARIVYYRALWSSES